MQYVYVVMMVDFHLTSIIGVVYMKDVPKNNLVATINYFAQGYTRTIPHKMNADGL